MSATARHMTPKHDDSNASELNYILIMDTERDTGKFNSLEMNIDSILSFNLHYKVLFIVAYLQRDIAPLGLEDFEQ